MNEIKAGSEDDRLHGSASARLALSLRAVTIKRICIRDNSPPDECPVCLSGGAFSSDGRAESSARSERPNCRVLRIY